MGPLKGCVVGLYVPEVRPALDAESCSGDGITVPWSRGGGAQEQGRGRADVSWVLRLHQRSGSILLSMQTSHFGKGRLQVSCEGICIMWALGFSLERG